MANNTYVLPVMVAGRYVYNNVIRETRDTVVYGAVQKDMQRDVLVETLRPEVMDDPERVQFFLNTARVQANLGDSFMGSSLELFFADDTWHYARERLNGESLDSLLISGRKLSSEAMCELLIQFCRSCVYMDMLGVDNSPFALSSVYMMDIGFRYDNPAIAGHRSRSATRMFLTQAATELQALLDPHSPLADKVSRQLDFIRYNANWSHLEPMYLDEKLTRLQLRILYEK